MSHCLRPVRTNIGKAKTDNLVYFGKDCRNRLTIMLILYLKVIEQRLIVVLSGQAGVDESEVRDSVVLLAKQMRK